MFPMLGIYNGLKKQKQMRSIESRVDCCSNVIKDRRLSEQSPESRGEGRQS